MDLSNHFLIAMPGMSDNNFLETLTLVCEHNAAGALGFVVNRPIQIPVAELLQQQSIEFEASSALAQRSLYSGGPVEPERGFVLHSAEKSWSTTMPVGNHYSITASRDIIESSINGEGPEKSLFLLGYAGWAPGQLEQEVSANTWLTAQADPDILFDLPAEQRWRAAATRLGVDLSLLNSSAGHA